MNKPLTRLDDFDVQEVSVVDKAANRRKFAIYKKESIGMDESIIKAVLETQVDEETSLNEIIKDSGLDDDSVAVLKAATRLLAGFKDKLPSESLAMVAKAAGFNEPEAQIQKNEGNDMSSHLEAITKAQKVEIDALKKALDEQKDAIEKSVWRGKVEKSLSHYPGKSVDEMTEQLFKIAKADSQMAAELFETMKSASDSLKEGNLFKEAGENRHMSGNDTSALGQIKKMVESVIEKSNDIELTEAKAYKKVLNSERGKALYRQYLDENPRQRGA